MIFDLEKYIDEPLFYDDNKSKLDDQKLFLLGVKIRTDMVTTLMNGVEAKDIKVRKLDPAEDQGFAVINMIAASVLADWGFEFVESSEVEDVPGETEERISKYNQVDFGEAKILKKTISNFKMSDSKLREGAVIRALQDDFDAISEQLNNELNVFPAPMREMIMVTILDRMHSWEKLYWE